MGFEYYDRVAFINRDRMLRYLDAGVVTTRRRCSSATRSSIGSRPDSCPAADVRDGLGLDPRPADRAVRADLLAASSLHLAGEDIVRGLAGAGFNVIVKLHDRSLDPDPRYTAGIDWRARMRALEQARDRCAYVEGPDASPLLAAADVMVTDHSSVGFEYLVLDRPLIVFDAPDLLEAARINPEKVALLRSAATVVRDVEALAAAARAELARPGRLSTERRRVAGEMFHEPGHATARVGGARPRAARSPGGPRAAGAEPGRGAADWPRCLVMDAARPARPLDATVLIATYNRAALLDETLTWLARMRVSPALTWEVIVIDNNSTDDTRAVVERHVAGFPVPLRYLFEGRQGRSSALNAGIAVAEGAVLAFTDDDVRVDDGWLDAAAAPLLGPDASLAYTGGPVQPIWEADAPLARPDARRSLGHDRDPGSRRPPRSSTKRRGRCRSAPTWRRGATLFARIGGFRADLGRSGGRLVLGQEVPELLLRARGAGLRGMYVPAMQVHHHVPAGRLTRAVFPPLVVRKGRVAGRRSNGCSR